MRPVEIDDAMVVFPAGVGKLMPKMSEIPERFHIFGPKKTPENDFVGRWFFGHRGGASKSEWKAKPGIDERAAWRHLAAIVGSFEPKHEHKEAAVAYLLSEWFEPATEKSPPGVSRETTSGGAGRS